MTPSYHHLNSSNHYNSNRKGSALSISVDSFGSFGSGLDSINQDSERILSNLSHGSVDSNPLTSFNLPPLQTEHNSMNQESIDSRRYNSLWSPEIGDIIPVEHRLLSNTSQTFVASIQQGPVSYAAVPIFQNMARNDSSPLSSNESIKANPNRILSNDSFLGRMHDWDPFLSNGVLRYGHLPPLAPKPILSNESIDKATTVNQTKQAPMEVEMDRGHTQDSSPLSSTESNKTNRILSNDSFLGKLSDWDPFLSNGSFVSSYGRLPPLAPKPILSNESIIQATMVNQNMQGPMEVEMDREHTQEDASKKHAMEIEDNVLQESVDDAKQEPPPQEEVEQEGEYITEDEIRDLDVIPEAGAHGNNHYGNQLYRKVTFMSRDTYKRIPTKKRKVKGSFSRLIAQFCLDVGCRFLSPDGEGRYKVMTLEEARSKVAQRFREKKEMWIDGVKVDEAALFTRILEWLEKQDDQVKERIDEAALINRIAQWNLNHNM